MESRQHGGGERESASVCSGVGRTGDAGDRRGGREERHELPNVCASDADVQKTGLTKNSVNTSYSLWLLKN